MTDFDPANNENFPLEEAANWIARWKAAGGGFFCREEADGVTVQLAARRSCRTECDVIANELLGQPRLKMAVSMLVRNQWEKSLLANVPPAGSA